MISRHAGRTFGTSLLALIFVPGIALAQTSNTQPAPNAPRTETAPVAAPAPVKVAPVPGERWSGFYIGGTFGYGGGKADTTFEALPDGGTIVPDTLKPDTMGWAYGFYGGMDFQSGIFVGGALVDIMFSNMDGSVQLSTFTFDGITVPGSMGATQAIDWYSTVRGRAGVAFGGMLYYGTAGIGFERLDHRSNISAPGIQYPAEELDTKSGWVFGGGVEGRFSRLVSWRAEYLHMDFGTSEKVANPIPANPPFQTRHTWLSTSNVFTGSIGFRF